MSGGAGKSGAEPGGSGGAPGGSGGEPVPTREAVVEKIVEGGRGLARDGSRVVLLPLVAPGERVAYETVRERAGRVEARLAAVLTRSPLRVEPRCRVYGICGGCHLQHLAPAAQLDVKRAAALETLHRIGRVSLPDAVSIHPSPTPFGYRHRAAFHIDWRRDPPALGFHRLRSHDTVDLAECPLLGPAMNAALPRVRALLPDVAAVRPARVEVAATDDGRAEVAFGGGPAPAGRAAAALIEEGARWPALRALAWEDAPGRFRFLFERGEPLGYEVPDGRGGLRRLGFDIRVFTQANLVANRLLVEALLEATAGTRGGRLLDLYAGCGNLSIPLLSRFERAHLVEASGPALAHAERNAGPDRGRIDLTAGPAAEALARLASEGATFDTVLLDPPRSGAAAALRPLARLAPPRMIYVSCNVPTLARDLASLARAGYRVASLALFDFYPQTAHVEALADLRRAG